MRLGERTQSFDGVQRGPEEELSERGLRRAGWRERVRPFALKSLK